MHQGCERGLMMRWLRRQLYLLEDRLYDVFTSDSVVSYQFGFCAVCGIAAIAGIALFRFGMVHSAIILATLSCC
jgi:hypothetical protein